MRKSQKQETCGQEKEVTERRVEWGTATEKVFLCGWEVTFAVWVMGSGSVLAKE